MSDLINISHYGEEEAENRKTSINIFSVESVEVEQTDIDVVVRVEARVKAKLEQRCLKHSNVMSVFRMEARTKEYDEVGAVRKAIEQLLNHDYRLTRDYSFPKCDCSPSFDRVHYDFNGMAEPWRSLFEQLFKNEGWAIQKLLDKAK